MKITLTNKLTEQEIKQGLFGYINKRFKFLQTALILTGLFAFMLVWNILDGTLFTQSTMILLVLYIIFLAMMIGLYAFSYYALAKQVSVEKQAKYTISDEGIEVMNATGTNRNYAWLQIQKCLEYKSVYILFLTRQEFVILSKEAVGTNIQIIQKKIKEVQNG